MSKITDSLTCGKCGSWLFQFEEKPNKFAYQCLCCGQNFISDCFLPLRYQDNETALYKVGDTVRVVDFGQQYTTYSDWFEENNIGINFAARYGYGRSCEKDRNKVYTILAYGPHSSRTDIMLYLIEEKNTRYSLLFLFAGEALELVV